MSKDSIMRGYALSNFVLSPLQKGLQSTHAICRIRSANKGNPYLQSVYDEWEENHTTLIYLNGVFHGTLNETFNKWKELDIDGGSFMFPIPYAKFTEDEYTLNGATTAIACILHPRYYTPMACARSNPDFKIQNLNSSTSVNYQYNDAFDASAKEVHKIWQLNALVEQNAREVNPNDVVDRACFCNYTDREVFFMQNLNTFGMAS